MIEENLKLWLAADAKISTLKIAKADLDADIVDAQKQTDHARKAIQDEMAETGEYEINIEGEYCNYKISFTTPRESVKVADVNAVPDDFCKLVRTPKLKEIGDFIRSLETPPNWASIELGNSSLTYKVVKK